MENQHSPPIQGTSPRNSSPVQDGGNLTNNLSQLEANSSLSDKFNGISLEEKDEGLGTSSGGTSNSSSTANGGQSSASNLSSNFFLDRRAPGCEMKSLQKQLDYDQKRLLATRAIQVIPLKYRIELNRLSSYYS